MDEEDSLKQSLLLRPIFKKWYRDWPFKVVVVFVALVITAFVSLTQVHLNSTVTANDNITPVATRPYNMGMKITSTAFQNNGMLPKNYSCDGRKISPPLSFSEIPDNAKSLVLIVEDPDAPSGTFTHWVVYDIKSSARDVSENTIPLGGKLGKTSLGTPGYVAACPPTGDHRYIFNLYALDIASLGLKSSATREQVEDAMTDHVLDKAQLIALYKRK